MSRSATRFQRQRLTVARELRGLTKVELAERVGKTAGAISHFESGRAQPDADTLAALGLSLGVPAEFFGRPLAAQQRLLLEECHFRSLRSATQRERRQLLAFGTLLGELTDLVEQEVDLPPVDLEPSPIGVEASPEEIEAHALELRRQWGMGMGPIREPIRLLEQHGILVATVPKSCERVDAFSAWQGERPFVFLLDDLHSPSRVRFDAGHELGHLLLHSDVSAGDRVAERQADRFGAAFLVPRKSFLQHWQGMRARLQSFYAMKRHWNVSAAMLIRRAYDLGCISQSTYHRLFRQLTVTGARRAEPYETPVESASMLRAAVELAGGGLDTLAELLALRSWDTSTLLLGRPANEPAPSTVAPSTGEGAKEAPALASWPFCRNTTQIMTKKISPNYWVSPTPDGQWTVKREGAERASNLFDTQREANARARELAIKSRGERITQKRDGSIRSKDSYGNDPRSRKDTEH